MSRIAFRRDRRILTAIFALALLGLGVVLGSITAAQPRSDRARNISDQEAAALLGRPMPELGYRPSGLRRISLTADPLDVSQLSVVASYAVRARSVVTLAVFNASSIERLAGTPTEPITLRGTTASVSSRSAKHAGEEWTFLTYTWSRDGLSYALTVHLRDGLTRQDADRIAASIE